MTAAASRAIGATGVRVGAIGLGCMGMSSTYGQADERRCIAALEAALALGVTHLDTADMYGRGHNETLLGAALHAHRDQLVLATKFGYRFDDRGRRSIDSSAAWAREACDDSLRRLDTDRIDLYYLHRRNPVTPIEETMSALSGLVAAGKVVAVGLSEVSPVTLRRAHAIHPVSAVQMEYSLFTRDVEDEMLHTCRELGVSLVAYAPVGRGWLTGVIDESTRLDPSDTRRAHPRFGSVARGNNRRLADVVRSIGEEMGALPAQVALAWLLDRGDDVLPIPGTTNPRHVAENVAAAGLHLTVRQRRLLDERFPPGIASGARHTPENMRTLGR